MYIRYRISGQFIFLPSNTDRWKKYACVSVCKCLSCLLSSGCARDWQPLASTGGGTPEAGWIPLWQQEPRCDWLLTPAPGLLATCNRLDGCDCKLAHHHFCLRKTSPFHCCTAFHRCPFNTQRCLACSLFPSLQCFFIWPLVAWAARVFSPKRPFIPIQAHLSWLTLKA